MLFSVLRYRLLSLEVVVKISESRRLLAPIFFREPRHQFLSLIYPYRLAKFGLVLFADLRMRWQAECIIYGGWVKTPVLFSAAFVK